MSWDKSKPAGTDSLKNSDDDLRANFTEIELRRLYNLVENAAFGWRSLGTSAVPDKWVLEGTPTVAYDTVDVGYGDYAVKVTASGATDEGIKFTLTNLKVSTKYQVFVRTKVTAGDTSSLITTGATTNINEDSTSTSWESVTGEFITDASATNVVLKLVASADGDVAYFCGITVVEGDIPPANFIRRQDENIGDIIIKGWIQFNGTGTIAIQDSFNVSSITDSGTGDYTVNWDTDFANDDYAVTSASNAWHCNCEGVTVGTLRILTTAANDAATDYVYVFAIAIGDQ